MYIFPIKTFHSGGIRTRVFCSSGGCDEHFFLFKGLGGCSEPAVGLDPGLGRCEALLLVEKTIYCATVDQQDNILQVKGVA
jgi:hypothetical protein